MKEREKTLKAEKTNNEKSNIENLTAQDSQRLMENPKVIKNKILEIKRKIDKKSRGNTDQSTLSMLFDIEAQLH